MKNVLMKISAIALVIWYCLSIIGFDVHTCSETGDSFVHISFTSHSCHDIHDATVTVSMSVTVIVKNLWSIIMTAIAVRTSIR